MTSVQHDPIPGKTEFIGFDQFGCAVDSTADLDAVDPPSESDERWNAETSPLRDLYFVEGDDPTAIELWTVSEAEYREPGPEDWAEYEREFDRIDAQTGEYRSREFYP